MKVETNVKAGESDPGEGGPNEDPAGRLHIPAG